MNTAKPLASILVDNYNYGPYLREAIDSALNQTYSPLEVVVVDDGSTDNSREIIASYEGRIITVLKENGGQASALNAGYKLCHGEVIFLLDSDDIFEIQKVQTILNEFPFAGSNDSAIMIYHPLEAVDKESNFLGFQLFEDFYSYKGANFYQFACKYGYVPFYASPTSGIVINRKLANLIFPLPETIRISVDDFIVRAGFLMGKAYGFEEKLARYRLHGQNNWFYVESKQREGLSKEFLTELDSYLNEKLKQTNRSPVLSVFNSPGSVSYYKHHESSFELIKLSWRVIRRNLDNTTIKVFLYVHFLVLKRATKKILGIKRPSL